jgi:hypothetical protein
MGYHPPGLSCSTFAITTAPRVLRAKAPSVYPLSPAPVMHA